MVKLNKIYTRTGDGGSAGLVDGSRVSKASLRMAAIGDIDEANASVGVAIAALDDDTFAASLHRIQNELFDLGADVATPDGIEGALRIVANQVERLEREIDCIKQMKYAGYFLIVWDFIKYAKDHGIPVGPGRGSAAGSLVALFVGLTITGTFFRCLKARISW